MATNTLSPNGLSPVRNFISGSNTYQATQRLILGSYATQINFGDVVSIGPSGVTQGYVILAADSASSTLGVFGGLLPYYNSSIGQTINKNGWVSDSGAPTTVGCLIYDDPFIVFQAQLNGAYTQNMAGKNINWTAATNGATSGPVGPSYISVLSLDAASVDVSNTLPFKIIGLAATLPGGPQDPSNTNPIIEVRLNTSQMLASGGI